MDHETGVRKTAEHYTKQWGGELDFQSFVKKNPEATKAMPSRQLPWQDLFDKIRARAQSQAVRVYDAACGFGDILRALTAEPNPPQLQYLGSDVHDSLGTIERPANADLVQHDISQPLERQFEYVICRAAIHHTPDPRRTYSTLSSMLAPGGTLAITAYVKKAPMREAIDDALRARIVPMPNDEAFAVAGQFTRLGRDLQAADGLITIRDDLPFLGIPAGQYKVQEFLYRFFMKCWHNPAFSEKHCDLVNFDWYHPPFAFRYDLEELLSWVREEGLELVRHQSTEAQHFVEARKRS